MTVSGAGPLLIAGATGARILPNAASDVTAAAAGIPFFTDASMR